MVALPDNFTGALVAGALVTGSGHSASALFKQQPFIVACGLLTVLVAALNVMVSVQRVLLTSFSASTSHVSAPAPVIATVLLLVKSCVLAQKLQNGDVASPRC